MARSGRGAVTQRRRLARLSRRAVIIVDRALEERERQGNPIRVAMVGAGFMGHGIALQILRSTPGVELVAIANRTLERARDAYAKAGAEDVVEVDDARALEQAIERGTP